MPRTATRERCSIRLSGADYSILQLLDQYDSVLARLQQLEGIVWIDLDEVRNRIAIGVRPGAEGSLTAALRGRGADLDMFYFEVVTELPVPLHTLQSQFDTLMGGIQVTASGVCTLGVTVERSGSIEGFLTASHCVGTVFSMDSVAVGQPSSSDTVGTESIDPDVFACGDPDGCRYSDAVLVDVASGVDINLGLIAATTDRDSIRQLNVDHNNPVEIAFEVTSTPAVGTDIDKIGRSSGWSYGEIDQSCVNFVHQSSVTLICQYRTDAWAEGGDSGSPVFIGPISSDVQLAGILHSGDQDGDYLFWYSPIEGVHDDLGSFQVAAGPS